MFTLFISAFLMCLGVITALSAPEGYSSQLNFGYMMLLFGYIFMMDDNIREISRFVKENMPATVRYELLAFNNLCKDKYERLDSKFPLSDAPLIEREVMERLAEIARSEGAPDVRWSGATKMSD